MPCEERDHDARWPCPLHGCPECLIERAAYENVSTVIDAETYWEVEALHDDYVDPDNFDEPCQLCSTILYETGMAKWPGWRCELRPCLHCAVCGLCSHDSGRVCRGCLRCLDHAAADGPCGTPRWDPRLHRESWSAVHETYDPVTGRWAS